MSFLLKIVEGPNKGAEIALVEGVAVTVGKGDDCDIVLADSTMPDAPATIEVGDGGVTIDGAPLEPFHVKTLGATSFAVGPADAPWEPLVWPKAEEESPETPETPETPDKPESPETPEKPESPEKPDKPESKEKPRRRLGCIVALAVLALLLLLAAIAWFARSSRGSSETGEAEKATLSDIAERYGLSLSKSEGGEVSISGNLKTRRERLAATAEAYQARPGVELDLTDDESFRTAAEDALFTLTEGALKVVVATNRVLSVTGEAKSPAMLKDTLEALNADLPKLRDIDVSEVFVGSIAGEIGETEDRKQKETAASLHRRAAQAAFPVCGILTVPYPCLVLRDGRRVMEGAEIGGNVILKIDADSVTLTNSQGRWTWKP